MKLFNNNEGNTSIKLEINLDNEKFQKMAEEAFEKCMQKSFEEVFSGYIGLGSTIRNKIKESMLPQIEAIDYSKYIPKLDNILTEVIKTTTLDNTKMLENFKDLMLPEEEKTIKVTDLFDKWANYVSKKVNTSELEVVYEDGASYQNVDISFEVCHVEERSWSRYNQAKVIFECEQDEEMNYEFNIEKYDIDNEWSVSYKLIHDIKSLRHLSEFEVFILRISQNGTKLILDKEQDNTDIEVEAEPEASYN